jgi:hypothetical protein
MDLNAIFEWIYLFISDLSWEGIITAFPSGVEFVRPFSTVVSLLFLTGIAYCFFRIEQIEEQTRHEDHPDEAAETGHARGQDVQPASTTTKRFERILEHLSSPRESDWRLAVLEADVLLSEMVTNMGYHGDSLGEKLKSVEASDFTSLQKAWEAHAVRNRVAHEGAAFTLTEREAKRVIGLYEEVFREFKYV